MVIDYDPDLYSSGFGFVRIVTAFHGTVLPHVLKSGLFWVVVILHALLHVAEFTMHYDFACNQSRIDEEIAVGFYADERSGALKRPCFIRPEWKGLTAQMPGHDGLPRVDWNVGVVSFGLCVFFLVFYVNSQHLRFLELYSHITGIAGTTMVWVGLCKMHLQHASSPSSHRMWNAVRYLVAASQCFYYSINSTGDVRTPLDRHRSTRARTPVCLYCDLCPSCERSLL